MWQQRYRSLVCSLLLFLGWAPFGSCQEGVFDRTLFRPFSVREPAEPRNKGESAREDEIRTDRDAFTPATLNLDRGRFVLESSYSFIDNRRGVDKHSFPELLMRYGATDWLELRFGWNYEAGGGANIASGQDVGESDPTLPGIAREHRILYGIKAQVTRQKCYVPESALIVHGYTTFAEKPIHTVAAGYVFGWELPRKWRLDSAINFATAEEESERYHVWSPSTVLRIPLSERWQVHAEYFALLSAGREENTSKHFFSPGAHFLVTPNFEVGARVGWGLNDQSARFFANVGFGWRF